MLYNKLSIQNISHEKDMMTEIINLNKKRKTKNRIVKEKKAAENRIKFGRTKKQKQIAKLESDRDDRHLDGLKLETKDKEQE